MFACMGCRDDDAFLNCFGGEPLAEEESEAEPEKAPRRKIKRRESKRRAARRPADPPPKPESRWGLVRRSVVKEPKLVEVVEAVTAYYDVSEARDRLRERLGKGVSTAQTKRMMLDVGADQHGRVSPRDFEVMVARFEEDRLVKKSRRKFWRRRAKKPPKAPKELYAPSAIHADAKALAKPLPKASACVEIKILRRVRAESSRRPPRHRRDASAASSPRNDLVKNFRVHPSHWLISTQAAGCDWDQLLDAHGRDFEALFGQVNDATLQESTSAGNTIVHYLAQIGDVERLAVVLRRTVGRQIVHRRNARGHTALEYAAARGHDGVAQTLSCYNQEHLADEHVADKMLSHHATRSYRVARQASCAARGSMPK